MEAALRGTNNTAPKRAPMPPPHAAAPSVPPVPPRITQQPSMRHVRQVRSQLIVYKRINLKKY